MQQFPDGSQYLDWRPPAIISQAAESAIACRSDAAIARRCFESVRDAVKYGGNHGMNPEMAAMVTARGDT